MFAPKYISWLLLLPILANAQTSFVASWDFEGNRNGSSNNANVTASSLNLSGINELGFPAGASGNAVSLGGWSTTASPGDYVEFSVSPQAYRIAIASVSFDANRSAQGPTQLVVRCSTDGFSSNIGSMTVGTGFSGLNIGQSLTQIETTVTYRIYGYSATSGSGSLRIDNLKINGTVALVPLPVELITFKAQPFQERIELIWETAWERNTASFEVQRSSDLHEFITLATITAQGTTREKINYFFVDADPIIGLNYYRLRQTDIDGKIAYSKIISAIVDNDAAQLWLYQNPIVANQIKLRLQNLSPAQIKILNLLGQEISFSFDDNFNNNYTLRPATILPSGQYVIVGQNGRQRTSKKIVVE